MKTLLILSLICLSLVRATRVTAQVPAELPRHALVMGVGDYNGSDSAGAFKSVYKGKPVQNLPGIITADLPLMAAKLKKLGFTVTTVENPTLAKAKAAVDAFSAKIKAQPGVSLFYFSGHGGEYEGKNFLIPQRANIGSKGDLAEEALSAQRVLNGMEESGAQVNLVFLDCCREDLGKSVGGSEMAPLKAKGSFIGFATRSGDFADPEEQGSPYTRFLLKHMDKPGISVADMYAGVIADVKTYSKKVLGEERRPGYYSELDAPFYFLPVSIQPTTPFPSTPLQDTYTLLAGKTPGERRLVEVAPGVTMAFRWCPPGRFTMGSSDAEKSTLKAAGVEEKYYSDEIAHNVTLTRGFWLAETEITQGQWTAVMKTTLVDQANKMLDDDTLYTLGGTKQTLRDYRGSKKGEGSKHIGTESENICMYFVNWEEADEWCTKASRHAAQRGWAITLPTEAQWEYGCRAGTTTMTYGGDFSIKGENNAPGLDPVAWYGGNSSQGYTGTGWNTDDWKEKQYPGGSAGPRRVGSKQANDWGLKDMLGNVFEWCGDYYGGYPTGNVSDPTGASSGAYRVHRGGSWGDLAALCRAAIRDVNSPGFRGNFLGFRPALVPSK